MLAAVETMAYSCGPSSFHHSDGLAFNLSGSSMDFDEATEPVHQANKIDSTSPTPPSSWSSVAVRTIQEECSSSWPVRDNNTSNKNKNNNKKKKNSRRLSLRSSASFRSKKRQKTGKVRFSPTLEVRTHSIVLGDHPFCEDGLALELGWDYKDSRDICHQGRGLLESPKKWRKLLLPNYPCPERLPLRSSSPPRHLSTIERKSLLLEVGGCSETEIKLRQFQTTILLRVQRLQEERLRTPPRSSRNRTSKSKPQPLYAAMA